MDTVRQVISAHIQGQDLSLKNGAETKVGGDSLTGQLMRSCMKMVPHQAKTKTSTSDNSGVKIANKCILGGLGFAAAAICVALPPLGVLAVGAVALKALQLHIKTNEIEPIASPINFNSAELRENIEKDALRKTSLLSALENSDSTDNLTVRNLDIADLEKVTNPSEICVATKTFLCSKENTSFDLVSAVAMRKGTEKLGTPKAMGEDAFVLDQVSIKFKDQQYNIPIMATLDGGGGHTLAQHGKENIKSVFEEKLKMFIHQNGRLDGNIILTAMKETDKALFGKFSNQGKPDFNVGDPSFPGSGYAKLRENHNAVIRNFGIDNDQFKGIFQHLSDKNGEKLKLNPMEIYKEISLKNNTNINPVIEISGEKYDLSIKDIAEKLQLNYEMSIGTINMIEVQVVMNAFIINANNELECITYNRGDSMAFYSESDNTKALSQFTSANKTNESTVVLSQGDRVMSACDGVREVISIDGLQKANNHPMLKDKNSQDYVTNLMQASIKTGSGDDKTIVSTQIFKKS